MWTDEYVIRIPDNRIMCERCGEPWHDDNIVECANCQLDTCPDCSQIVSIRGRARREWWCNACLEFTGKTEADFVTEAESVMPAVKLVQSTPRSLSVGNLKCSVLRDRDSVFIRWSPDELKREILRDSLKVLGFNIEDDGRDFEVAPANLPKSFTLLVFTKAGIRKLTKKVGVMIPYPERLSALY